MSTPELDKLRALSECFQVTMDELAGSRTAGACDDAVKEDREPAPRRAGESRLGLCLCITGALCLILLGILTVMCPSCVSRIDDSSMITLNGTGMLITLFVLLMILGMVLTFKKK